MSDNAVQKSGGGLTSALLIVGLIFVILVAVGTWAAYAYGDVTVTIDGEEVVLEWWEVAAGIAAGMVGLVIGLLGGLIGLLIGLVAGIAGLAVALAAGMLGLFIAVGVVLGPFLLLAAIVILIRRRNKGEG